MNRDTVAVLFFSVIIAAIIYSLVRPGSRANQALTTVTDALVAIIGTATGYTQRGG
jgi:hypothetical protein